MAERKPSGGPGGDDEVRARDERVQAIGERASSVVRQAADVLEGELAAGIDEARRLQERFTEQRRLESGDLDELAARVRRTAHEVIDLLTERFGDLSADDVRDSSARFSKDSHQVLDAVMNLVDLAPGVVNELAERTGVAAGDSAVPRDDTGTTPTAKKAAAKKTATKSATRKSSASKTTASKSAARKTSG